jgi:hypothetical protein
MTPAGLFVILFPLCKKQILFSIIYKYTSDYSIHYRAPEFLVSRPNWVPHTFPPSECVPLRPKGGSNTRLRVREWGSQFQRLDRKPGILYTPCSDNYFWITLLFYTNSNIHYSLISIKVCCSLALNFQLILCPSLDLLRN